MCYFLIGRWRAQPCVQPTRLWRERVGAIFGKLGYAEIVLKLQTRRAANAPVRWLQQTKKEHNDENIS